MKPHETAAIRARIGRIARRPDVRLHSAREFADGRWRSRYALEASYAHDGTRRTEYVFSTSDLGAFLEMVSYARRAFAAGAEEGRQAA